MLQAFLSLFFWGEIAYAAETVEQLQAAGARVVENSKTGVTRFIGFDAQTSAARALNSAFQQLTPEAAAGQHLESYGPLFGLRDAATETKTIKQTLERDGRSMTRHQQLYKGVPVIAGELIVNQTSQRKMTSISGKISPNLSLDTTPVLTAEDAKAIALQAMTKWYGLPETEFVVPEPTLSIYDARLMSPHSYPAALVWQLDVSTKGHHPINEFFAVDASTGAIALHFNQVPHAKDRRTYDAANTTASPGTLVCNESNPTCAGGIADAVYAHRYAGATYDFYANNFGRNSIDNLGMPMVSTVRVCPVGQCPWENANWNGAQMSYGQNIPKAEDVVGHELTHGVTQYESKLYYYYQSGAINESLSDVFGELIQQSDSSGTVTPSTKWLIGEDLASYGLSWGAFLRSMKDPTLKNHPDRMTSSLYYKGPGFGVYYDDGGVHTNSGVNNKAAYLMVEGGVFNGRTIAGIGLTKTAQIYYRVQTNLLTSGSDYLDLHNALYQACQDLVGTFGIGASDCVSVQNATLAVEMNLPPSGGFNPDASMCPAGQSPSNVLFSDNFESGFSRWGSSPVAGSTPWYISSLYAANGVYSLSIPNPASVYDLSVFMASSVTLPANAHLWFNHAFGFETANGSFYDGGVLEYSTNGGVSWVDAASLFAEGQNYGGTISPSYDNPLRGRTGFVGESHGYVSSRFNLSALAGQSVRFRWRVGSDNRINDVKGWYVDDVKINACSASSVTLPSAPTNVVTVAGNASATVSFMPGSVGSGALIRYEASCGKVSDGSWSSTNLTTATGTSSPITVSGLTNGIAYYCWVKTQTSVGYSPWSAESAPFTPTNILNLTVTKSGAGTGSVTSAPAGISCGTTCSANYAAGTIVTLTAAPASGSTFSGWSGACTGTSSCVVSMSTAQSVVAVFALPTSTLPSAPSNVVAVAGNASATVSFVPGSVGSGALLRYEASCGKVSDGSWSSINLTTATGTSSPITVSGLTNGIAYYCWVITQTTVGYGPWSAESASFTPISTLNLTVTKSGAGTGSVTSAPAGISCGTTCSASYAAGTVVTLTAAPSSGSTFSGWSGACSGISSCVVSMSTAQSVVAAFALTSSTLPSAPTNVAAVSGNASATVSFVPGSVGSGSLIRHEASCGKVTDGSWSSTNLTTATGTSSPITVSGLSNGTAYYCWVITLSTAGYGPWSAESASFTPISTLSAPVCSLSASPSSISPGSSSLLTASCSPAASSYVWTGGTCAGTTAATCTVTPTGTTTYSVAGVNSGGTGTAASASVTVTALTTRLINLSTRGQVLSGDNVMIGGFIIQGSASKTVLIRAVGPTLANFGVSGVLRDPALQLFSGQTQIAANDDWQTASNAAAIQATTLAPSNTKESAILTTLAPGAYTAIVSGVGGATGVGIVEVYDIDHPEVPLINISTRGQVQTGDNVMIGGFIIQGTSPQTVLIRAVGPNLANFGVSGVLADPKLELYSGQSVIASNDNWQTATNAAAIQATTLAPVDPREAAILITLQPGAYTAVVSGANGGVGVGIIEVFAR